MKTLFYFCALAAPLHELIASDWVATSSSDMNDMNNWNPNTAVPGPGDEANFDNLTPTGVILNPTDASAFSVADINFTNAASPFTFQLTAPLTFNNVGITGAQTDTTINVTFTNIGSLADQVSFVGATANSGSAILNVTNIATASGGDSNVTRGSLGNQIIATGDYTMSGGGQIVLVNQGTDSSISAGGNIVALSIDDFFVVNSVTAGDNATFIFSNSGTNTGTGSNSVIGSTLVGGQMDVINNFLAGDSLTITVTNSGTESGSNGGGNQVGLIQDNQVAIAGTFQTGDNALITVSNTGTDSSISGSAGGNRVGFVGQSQFTVGLASQVGKNFTLTCTNIANNTGNSPIVGQVGGGEGQIFFEDTLTMDDGGNITAFNSGFASNYQILFLNGFVQTSGRSNVTAINEGIVYSYGIEVVGYNEGGNVLINLTNSSLNINTTSPTFEIGGLNGNSNSGTFAQSNAQLIINTDSDVSADFAGVIENFPAIDSSLVKQGLGTQKLSGFNTYTGPTFVNQGILNLTGTISGDMSINPGGTLIGTGSVLGHVVNDGTISPGESIGTITFGSFTGNSDGIYVVELNGQGQSDLIVVNGFADVQGGLVQASSIDGTFNINTPYLILTSQNLSGDFAAATYSTSASVKPILTTANNNIYLTLATQFQQVVAKTHNNSRKVANQLDNITNPTPQQELLLNELIFLPEAQLTAALNSLSGSQHTNDVITSTFINRQFVRRLYDPIRSLVTTMPCCYPCSEVSYWIEAGGTMAELTNSKVAHGFNYNGYEITGGVQKTFSRGLTLGLATSYENDHLRYKNSGGKATNQTWLAGLYGLYRPTCFYGLVDIAYGYEFNRVDRSIQAGSLNYHAHSNPHASQVTFYGEVGIDINANYFLFQPFIGIEGAGYWRNHFVESPAGGWGMEVRKRERSTANTRLGFHLTAAIFSCVDLSLDLAWDALLNNRNNTCNNKFIEFGNSMDIFGVNLDSNSVDYAFTLSTKPLHNLRVYLEGSGEWWNRANLGNIQAGLIYSW